MKTKAEILAKLAKWYQRAQDCTDRSEVQRIIKKARKHAKRLAELESEL